MNERMFNNLISWISFLVCVNWDFGYILIAKYDWVLLMLWYPGGRLNKKDGLTRYGNSHVKDKTS